MPPSLADAWPVPRGAPDGRPRHAAAVVQIPAGRCVCATPVTSRQPTGGRSAPPDAVRTLRTGHRGRNSQRLEWRPHVSRTPSRAGCALCALIRSSTRRRSPRDGASGCGAIRRIRRTSLIWWRRSSGCSGPRTRRPTEASRAATASYDIRITAGGGNRVIPRPRATSSPPCMPLPCASDVRSSRSAPSARHAGRSRSSCPRGRSRRSDRRASITGRVQHRAGAARLARRV